MALKMKVGEGGRVRSIWDTPGNRLSLPHAPQVRGRCHSVLVTGGAFPGPGVTLTAATSGPGRVHCRRITVSAIFTQ